MAKRSDDLRNGGNGPLEADERLSAYLDGECTAAEQAEIEAQMSANADFRQLVEELRGVRTSLEVLPHHRLDAEFASRVLRRAEREVLLGAPSATPAVAPATVERAEAPVVSVSSSPGEGSHRSARPFIWTIAALAAAILILVTQREPEMRPDPIAKGPDAPKYAGSDRDPSSAKPTTEVKKEDGGRSLAGSEVRKESTGRGEPIDQLAEGSQDRLGASAGILSDDKAMDERLDLPAATGRRDVADQIEEQIRADRNAQAIGQTLRDQTRRDLVTDSEARGDVTLTPAAPKSAGLADSPPPAPAGTPQAMDLSKQESTVESFADQGGQSGGWGATYAMNLPRQPVQVVEVDVTRQAWQRGDVVDVLARNGIALFDPEEKSGQPDQDAAELGRELTAGAEGDKVTAETEFKNQRTGGDAAAPQVEAINNLRGRGAVRRKMELPAQAAKPVDGAANEEAPSSGLELLIVNASRSQIDAALGELGAADEFRVVQVTSASPPGQMPGLSVLSITDSREETNGAAAAGPAAASAPVFRAGATGAGGAIQNAPEDRSDSAHSGDDPQKTGFTVGKKTLPAPPVSGYGREAVDRKSEVGQGANEESKAGKSDQPSTTATDSRSAKQDSSVPDAAAARRAPSSRSIRAKSPTPDADLASKPSPSSQTAPANENALPKLRGEKKDDAPKADFKDAEELTPSADKKQTTKIEALRANEPTAPAEQPPAAIDAREKQEPAIKANDAAESLDGTAAGRGVAGDGGGGSDASRARIAGGGYGSSRGGGGLESGGLGGYGYGNTRYGAFRGGFGGAQPAGGRQLDAPQMPAGSATRVRLLGRPLTLDLKDEAETAELKLQSTVERAKDATTAGEAVQEQSLPSDAFGARAAKKDQSKDVLPPQRETGVKSFGIAGISPDQNQAIDPRAPQQVLLFFRIVDAPIAKAGSRVQAGTAVTERAKGAIEGDATSQGREATPVPAPSAPSNPVK